MENTVFSLLPPLVAIVMVILTRRVLLSLGVGSIVAALFLADFQVGETFHIILKAAKNIFVADGSLNTGNINIILFLFILGVITAFISISGGSRSFGEWAIKRVRTRTGAQLTGAVLGLIIFIDDYFNSLAVGQIARPITDRNRVSRAKLSYLIDSTSAPVCVVSPISSWGAYIIGLVGTIFAAHHISGYTALSAFVQMIPMNFYVFATLAIVFIVAFFNIEIGPMEAHEKRAIYRGEVLDTTKRAPGQLKQNLPVSNKGSVGDLIWPILTLTAGTIGAMFWTGYKAVGGETTILEILENTDVAASLITGGLLSLVVTLFSYYRQLVVFKSVKSSTLPLGFLEGIKSMIPAVSILLFAWVLADLIGQLETGKYMAGLVVNWHLTLSLLPLILFVIAGIMAFSTGTSWGSFGILLPIAGEIAATTDISLLLPTMAAVLAGSVFGDHASPISDTTILSATGAGCPAFDHFITQLPYALVSAFFAAIGYLVMGLTGSVIVSLLSVILLLAGFTVLGIKRKNKPLEQDVLLDNGMPSAQNE